MSRKSRISFGPGAASLILIVVILSMSVLGILALMNARNDSRLIERSVEVVQAGYVLNEQAERALANLDVIVSKCAKLADSDEAYEISVRSNLPIGMQMNGREIFWEETDGYRSLECAVELSPLGSAERLVWRTHRLTAVTEDIWN